MPAGIDIAKLVLDKSKVIEADKIFNNIIGNGKDITRSNIIEEVKSKAGEIKNKILSEAIDLVKRPVKDKVTELFCPQR